EGLPHPGFVAVDTPLSHFKGPHDNVADPELTRDLHTAFLHSTANQEAGQYVVIDHIDPPAFEHEGMVVHYFTGGEVHGRTGFYPERSPQG
ncbi:MAG: hypothetical protein JWM25_1989, partial [Thermoleophilia bacterium]|nr:hypothetical protein [Thermoleophilia bacterium]